MSTARIFGLRDWEAWLDGMATRLLGMTGAEFEAAYNDGRLAVVGSAGDLAAVLPMIQRLRRRDAATGPVPPAARVQTGKASVP